MNDSTPMTYRGLKVHVHPDQPRMQLGEAVKQYLTPAQIADHNGWMLGFFGTTNMLRDGQYVLAEQLGFVIMNPRTYENFKKAAMKEHTHG